MRRVLVDFPDDDGAEWLKVESTEEVFHVGRQEDTTIIVARLPNEPEDGWFGGTVRLDLDDSLVLDWE